MTNIAPTNIPSGSASITTDEIVSKFANGNSPLDFITQNLRTNAPAVTKPPVPVQPPPTADVSFSDQTPLDFPVDVPPAAPVTETPPVEGAPPAAKETTAAEDLLDAARGKPRSKDESLKDLRKRELALKEELATRQAELAERERKISQYESGEAIPEVIQKKDEQISELSYFRDLHAFELSPEYQRNYTQPISEMKNKVEALVTQSGVDPTMLNRAFELQGKELNNFLKANIDDDLAAVEVRDIIVKMRDLHAESIAAKKKPAETLEQLRVEHRNREAAEQSSRVNKIVSNSREGWISALTELRATGEYPELTPNGNIEHDALVGALLKEAGEELGKSIRLFGMNGLRELPLDVAKVAAKRFILSQITSVTAASRANHHRRAEQVIADSKANAPFLRPSVGSGANGNGAPPARKLTPEQSLTEGADRLLAQAKENSLRRP